MPARGTKHKGLSKQQREVLRQSSKEGTALALGSLSPYHRRRRWIASTNRYRANATECLRIDVANGGSPRSRDLAQYIAASAPVHCADGWSLLGRALDAHARCDPDSARHFAYYAELRATMSLLAAEGIGVFNAQHFVVDSAVRCKPVPEKPPQGTHQMAWRALHHWSGLKRAADLLGKIIRPGGRSLELWFELFSAGTNLLPVGSRLLRDWGLDLRILSKDRDARNAASYRPGAFSRLQALNAMATSAFLTEVWRQCEPAPDRPFEQLDRHFLRLSLERAFRAVTGQEASSNPRAYSDRVTSMLGGLSFSQAAEYDWLQFLTRSTEAGDPPVIAEALRRSPPEDPRHHVQVIARAIHLLRVATGACALFLKSQGIDRSRLRFWWAPLGEERGLWEPGAPPDEFHDLWADAGVAVDDLRDTVSSKSVSIALASWRRDYAGQISVLGTSERIALWGLRL